MIQDIPHCLTYCGAYPVDDAWLRSHPHIWEEDEEEEDDEDEIDEGGRDEGEDEGDKYFEGAVLCEVGEHWVTKGSLLPHFADCYECVTVKEYAEHRGISTEKAQRICDGEEGEDEGEEEGEGEGEEEEEDEYDEASKEEEARMLRIMREEEDEYDEGEADLARSSGFLD